MDGVKVTTEGLVKWSKKTSEVAYKRFREHIREKTCLVVEIYHLWQCDFIYDCIYIHITRTGQRLLRTDSSMPFTIINYNPNVWQREVIWGPVRVFRLKGHKRL